MLLGSGIAMWAVVLVVAGSLKIADPVPLTSALNRILDHVWSSSVGVSPTLVRLIAAVEIATGIAVVLADRGAALLAIAVVSTIIGSLGAAGVVLKVEQPCGCFGSRSEAPVGATALRFCAAGMALSVGGGLVWTTTGAAASSRAAWFLALLSVAAVYEAFSTLMAMRLQ